MVEVFLSGRAQPEWTGAGGPILPFATVVRASVWLEDGLNAYVFPLAILPTKWGEFHRRVDMPGISVRQGGRVCR